MLSRTLSLVFFMVVVSGVVNRYCEGCFMGVVSSLQRGDLIGRSRKQTLCFFGDSG